MIVGSNAQNEDKGENVSTEGEGLGIVACEYILIESFMQLKEGEIHGSLDESSNQKERDVKKSDNFTPMTRKRRELVLVKDHGVGKVMADANSSSSLTNLGRTIVGPLLLWTITLLVVLLIR
ncbi:hypothetical protein Csa_009513 [Cucumis sativus]|uniref:Uncharacterized protein n=1 Tax=Cucumis sativus TaxID=3659 RepID=A0A0A0LAL0_CUCSA|nr:hypothetical protein Csa_009513 [Cucumis sativus]